MPQQAEPSTCRPEGGSGMRWWLLTRLNRWILPTFGIGLFVVAGQTAQGQEPNVGNWPAGAAKVYQAPARPSHAGPVPRGGGGFNFDLDFGLSSDTPELNLADQADTFLLEAAATASLPTPAMNDGTVATGPGPMSAAPVVRSGPWHGWEHGVGHGPGHYSYEPRPLLPVTRDTNLDDLSTWGTSPTAIPLVPPGPAWETAPDCNCDPRCGDWYVRSEFLYWEQTDPRELGRLFSLETSQDFGAPTETLEFSTGQPNTNPGMGVQILIGRQVRERMSWEVGGFWVRDFKNPALFRTETVTQDGFGTTVFNNQAIFLPLDEDIQEGDVFWQVRNWGLETGLRYDLYRGKNVSLDLLAGFRYLQYYERFRSGIRPTQEILFDESFTTENHYVGPQMGLEGRLWAVEYVYLRGTARYGAMINFQDVFVGGPADGSGRLTGLNNLGSFDDEEYGSLIDVGIDVVFVLTPNIHVNIGYNGIWLDNTIRAMDQLDFAGIVADDPQFPRRKQSIWLYGLNAGVHFQF